MDLIDRQAAIDAVLSIGHIAKLTDGDAVIRMSAVNYVLRNLPSAETTQTNDSNALNALDCISRQAAIEALLSITKFKTRRELVNRCDASIADSEGWLGCVAECIDEIDDLPSAQPRKGKWVGVEDEDGCVKCGVCMKSYDWTSTAQYYNFCPNCGALMSEGEGDESAET